MTTKFFWAAAWLAVSALPAFMPAQAAPFRLNAAKSSIKFQPHARFGDGSGEFKTFDVQADIDHDDLTRSRLEATIDVASIDTGIKKRDKHLRTADFFDAASFPTATLAISRIEPNGPQQYLVAAELTLKGVQKSVPLAVSALFEGGGFHVVGKGTINRKQFNVNYDSKLNPIRDDVDISFDITLVPVEPEAEPGTEQGPPVPAGVQTPAEAR